VRYPVSRLVVDPERFEVDAQEVMAGRGMGVVYTTTSDLKALRLAPSAGERERLLNCYYRPHHRRLEAAVSSALSRFGRCLVVDCHSFPSLPLPHEPVQSADRPDVCIGTDEFHTPAELVARAVDIVKGRGLRVEVDSPFSGSMVPESRYRSDRRVLSLMVEVNRGLYMDEASGARKPEFQRVRRFLGELVDGLHDCCRAWPGADGDKNPPAGSRTEPPESL
jgi:N-formylglutamate amidohydrolase